MSCARVGIVDGTAVGTLTYDIDTSIPRNGDDGVEGSEIDTWSAPGIIVVSMVFSPAKQQAGDQMGVANLPTTLMLGGSEGH